MIDYHIHTSLCNHARGSMEAYIRRAAGLGFAEICFLDHLTFRNAVQKPGHGLSMVPGEVPLYFQAVQRFKQKYLGTIDVKTGVEIDFNPDYVDLFLDILETYAFDVVGSSLHFPGDINIVSSGSVWKNGEMDADDVYGVYFEQFEKMLDYGYFDVICHLDLVKKFGRKPSRSFDDALEKILAKIYEKGLTVEINTSGYDHAAGEPYPSPEIIHRCGEKGIPVTLGSDAHRPEDIGRHYDRAIPVLRSAGYRYLSTFSRRSRRQIAVQ